MQAQLGAEVLVVDDGSADSTTASARQAGATVVTNSCNQGKGSALIRGAEAATGDLLVFIDADGQDDPADIPELLAAMDTNVAMVVGSRFLGHFDSGSITRLHHFGNKALTKLVNICFGSQLTDTQAGFRVLRRQSFLDCSPTARGFAIEVEIVLEVLRAGGRIIEVPVRRLPREHGRSRLSTVRDGAKICAQILKQRLKPRRSPLA